MRKFKPWQRLRLGLVILVFALTLAALLGGQGLARNLRVDRPLAREIAALEGVRDFSVEERNNGLHLSLTMNRVGDLERTVAAAVGAVEKTNHKPVAEIAIKDQRGDLDRVYYVLRFSLEEALATGKYTQLKQALDELTASYGLDRARIYLGGKFIYIQLEKGRSYLYAALPRLEIPRNGDSGGGAG